VNEASFNNEEEIGDSDEKEVADVIVKPPTNKKVLETLEVLKRAIYHQSINFNMQKSTSSILTE